MMSIVRATGNPAHFKKAAGALLLLLGLAVLSSCQGLSTASSKLLSGILSLASGSLSFGNVAAGSSSTLTVSATNSGNASLTITSAAVSTKYFSLASPSLPATIGAGQSLNLGVKFTPDTAGTFSGTVTLTSNGSNPQTALSVSGTGVAGGQLTVTPATLPLGNVVVGTSGTASGSLTASGANVTVTDASTNNSVFSVGGLSLPVTIPAGQSTSFEVTFSPLTTGAASSTLTFTSSAQPATTTESLTGTGTPAPTHTVALSWTASTSPNISGYNIYRTMYTTSCGSFSKINTALNTSTQYSDSTVTDGKSYCYAATAVDSSDAESAYSNIVSNVHIPAP
jgi:hypothetical protein